MFRGRACGGGGRRSLEFRLKLIGDDRKIPDFTNPKQGKPLDTARLKGVLKLAAEKAGWGKPLPKGVARGIAGYFSFESYTAAVAEVSVKDGAVKVHRLVYAVDCGRPINPEGVRAQVESAAIYALSASLHDAITIKGGRVEQGNFNDYEMPRIADTPKTEVHVVMSKEEPTGIGEPGLPVVAAAVCNANLRADEKTRSPLADSQGRSRLADSSQPVAKYRVQFTAIGIAALSLLIWFYLFFFNGHFWQIWIAEADRESIPAPKVLAARCRGGSSAQ